MIELRPPAGQGPKREGIPDLAIGERDHLQQIRSLVKCEAKLWSGQGCIDKGLHEILGTANSGHELFVALLVYCHESNFERCIQQAQAALQSFEVRSGDEGSRYRCLGTVEREKPVAGHTIAILRSLYGTQNGSQVTVYCYLADLESSHAKGARQAPPSRPRAPGG